MRTIIMAREGLLQLPLHGIGEGRVGGWRGGGP